MELEIPLLKHQLDFVQDLDHRYLAMVAGYGSGKTFAFCVKGIFMAFLNMGFSGALLEPTNAMASDVLIPVFEDVLNNFGIDYTLRSSPYPTFTLHFEEGDSTILIRSAENYRRLAGLNLAWFGVDEADTIQKSVAWKMWRLLTSRLRARAPHVQGFTTSTPEGYSFLYEYFVKEPREALQTGKVITNRRIIHARTYDNPFLEDDYIPSLLNDYPDNLVVSYLEGQFTNLLTGTVYHAFDRMRNHSNVVLTDFDEKNVRGEVIKYADVHVGMDFNVGKCCAICHIIDPDTNHPIAVDEITGEQNTETMIKSLKARFPKRSIIVYPDSSAKSEKTNAAMTDLKLLRQAGFTVKSNSKNPPVRDRVNSMNAMFRNAEGQIRYLVNTNKCPTYVEALETQAYDNYGKPDKQHDQDHPVDAGGYFIYKKYPLHHHHKKVKIKGF